MPLTEDERKQAEAAILSDLDREHARRLQTLNRKRERLRSRRAQQDQVQHELEIAAMREELRAQYYTERGYLKYVDSRGRESWLTPEEHEWRTKYRRRRHRNRLLVALPKGQRVWTIALYAGMLALAVVLGVLISR